MIFRSINGVISCDYAEQMRTLLAPLDEDGARELARRELASHGQSMTGSKLIGMFTPKQTKNRTHGLVLGQ